MTGAELRRLVVRHRHVAPMVSALLAGTDAGVTIRDADDGLILQRQSVAPAGHPARYPIRAGGDVVGSVEGDRTAAAVAAVLSYAVSRELDKRSLAQEALDRYRELSLVYDLVEAIGGTLDEGAVIRLATAEASRLLAGGHGQVLLRGADDGTFRAPAGVGDVLEVRAGEGILGAVAASGQAELVNGVADDARATDDERRFAALVAAPLRIRGDVVGLLCTLATDPIEYRASDLKVLGAIAALTALAIDQARTHAAAVDEVAERERMLARRLDDALGSATGGSGGSGP
jgi:hypothetical protein